MLVENGTGKRFGVGDHVKVKSLGMYGRIVEYKNGKWVVRTASGQLTEDATNLEPAEILLG